MFQPTENIFKEKKDKNIILPFHEEPQDFSEIKIYIIEHSHLTVVSKLNYQISVPYERRHTPLQI